LFSAAVALADVPFDLLFEVVERVCPELVPLGLGARSELEQSAFEESALTLCERELERAGVGVACFGIAAEPAQEIGTGRIALAWNATHDSPLVADLAQGATAQLTAAD
jgi:hypothetical protein